jgi:hypothetical protein
MDTKNFLEKFTRFVGWALWIGFYMLGAGGFFMLLDAIGWAPDITSWNFAQWVFWIAVGILLIIGYTMFMLMFVYLVRRYIHVGESQLRTVAEKKKEEKPKELPKAAIPKVTLINTGYEFQDDEDVDGTS